MSLVVAFLVVLSVTSRASHATLIDSADGFGRPLSISDFTTNSNVYDITITYSNNGDTNPLRVGALPDADIQSAASDLVSFLRTQPLPIAEAFLTFQANIDSAPPPPDVFEIKALVQRRSGEIDWDDSLFFNFPFLAQGVASVSPDLGFVQFSEASSVPEPSSIILLATGMLCLFGYNRRRKKRSVMPAA